MLAMLTRRGSDMIGPDSITGERITVADVDFLRTATRRAHVSDAIMRYAVDITATSRGAGSSDLKFHGGEFKGLDYSEEQFNANMALNPSEWQAELESQTELFDKVGKKLPAELEEQRQLLIKSFS